jgi:hypothetical protein
MKKIDTFWPLLTKVFFLFFVKFFCPYCSAQGDPLNSWTLRWNSANDPINRSSLIGPGFTYGQGTFLAAGGNIYQSGVFSNSNSPTASLAIATYPGLTINGIPGGYIRFNLQRI